MYVIDGVDGTVLEPIDPTTLIDDPSRRVLDTADPSIPGSPWAISSADGSTLAQVFYYLNSSPYTVRILDAATGMERVRFRTPVGLYDPQLSADGSRLVGQEGIGGNTRPVWRILDTSTGRTLGRVRQQGPDHWGRHVLISPDGDRLYMLVSYGSGSESKRPGPPLLVAYDLPSGRTRETLKLDDVLAGSWRIKGEESGADFVVAQWQPGFALSPDGGTIAVVHPDQDTLTLVPARSLKEALTLEISRPKSLLKWLGLSPATAYAKALEGVSLRTQFSPDGGTLYVTGVASEVDKQGKPHYRGLGLRAIDVRTGRIKAEALEGRQLYGLEPSQDGRSLYTFASSGESANGTSTLYRLEATDLRILATRQFNGYQGIYLFRSGPAR
jgi:DNA-binding beta-propeller fold protein YncE